MGILSIVGLILSIFSLLLLARALLSYFPQLDYSNPLVRIVIDVTEPVLRPIRRALPQQGPIDWSPMVAILAIWLIRTILRV